ncbi:alpha/beta hydrolase [Salinirubrum litoreum]|uniref:Alpha/beta hydrolase n=1 Tax=Salinirubrum litoreum TaxID=1126234 RepID=A0ABD5R7N6_9EURY|nr:alpha/beta hydrolase [Salinirubrum litoreum]
MTSSDDAGVTGPLRSDEPDPDARAVLAKQAERSDGPIAEVTLGRLRAGFDADPVHRVPEPTPMASVENLSVPGGDEAVDLSARVYRPLSDAGDANRDDGDSQSTVLVYFHGGGWVVGSLDSHDELCRVLARESGATVVSVAYRRAPEHPFPEPVADACAATEWVADNARRLIGDRDGVSVSSEEPRLVVAGDSAGANLAAAVGLWARDRRRDGESAPELDRQLLIYPTVSRRNDWDSLTENGEGYGLDRPDMRWFGDQYFGHDLDRYHPYACPLEATDLGDLPPASVVTCGFDPLRDEGIAYAEALAESGVGVTHHHYPDQIHGAASMLGEWSVPAGRTILTDVAGDL